MPLSYASVSYLGSHHFIKFRTRVPFPKAVPGLSHVTVTQDQTCQQGIAAHLSHLSVEEPKILAHPPTPRLVRSYCAWSGSRAFHDTSLCLCC